MGVSVETNANLSNAATTAVNSLKRTQEQLQQTAQNIASGSLDPKDVVDLSAEANATKVNVAVLKTTDEMTKSLLNVVA